MASSSPGIARIGGWLGLAVYLLCKRQRTLFWPHVGIPLLLGGFGIVFAPTVEQVPLIYHNVPSMASSWSVYGFYVGEASLFISLMTYPLSFFGVDP